MRRKILQELEELRESLEAINLRRKRLRVEKIKINSEILKLNKCLAKKDELTEEEVSGLYRAKELLNERIAEIKSIYSAICEDIKIKDIKFQALCNRFDELDGTQVFPFELMKNLERSTKKKWGLSWISSPEGFKLGYAFVREDDKGFNEPIIANWSISNPRVEVDNSETRKVVYAAIKYDPNDVLMSWDWMDFYLYAIVGVWNNEEMKNLFDDFIERDYDFAEQVTSVIRENFMKTEEEILHDLVHSN